MSDVQLLAYINQQLQNGALKEQIKNSLIAGSWKAEDVDKAFIEIAAPNTSVPLPPGGVRHVPGIGKILSESFSIYKQRIGTFVGIMAVPALLSAAWVITTSLPKQSYIGSFPAAGIGLLFFILSFFVQVWGSIALVYAIKDREEKIGAVAAYGRAWKMILPYIWVTILTSLIVMGGMILFIVPGIIFSIWFSMTAFVLINENVRGMNALSKSKAYARGKWIDLFIRYLALALVCIGILIVERILFAFLHDTLSLAAQNIVNSLLIAPVTTAYLFLTYRHVKESNGEAAGAAARPKMTAFIIVAVIGLLIIPVMLSTIAITSLGAARTKARDAKRFADIKQIETAIEMYYADNDKLPAALSDLNLYGTFVDPSTKEPYKYVIDPNGTDYKVCANLESTKTEKCISTKDSAYNAP